MGSGSNVATSGEVDVLSFLPESPLIFDVGANRGEFAKLVYTRRPKANLHCFEPSSHAFALLSVALVGTGAKVNNLAVSSKAEVRTLYSDKPGSELASLTRRDIAHHGIEMCDCEKVFAVSIDEYCEQNKISSIDLLKVDVEGHELDVFNGSRKMFDAGGIRHVLFEFGGCNIDTRTYFKDFFVFLNSFGAKKIYRISASGSMVHVNNYSECFEVFFTTNYFVVF